MEDMLPNGPRISCGDSSTAHNPTFPLELVRRQVHALVRRLLWNSSSMQPEGGCIESDANRTEPANGDYCNIVSATWPFLGD